MWFEHDDPLDHPLSDLDGPSRSVLVTDLLVMGYFNPCSCSGIADTGQFI